MFRTIEEKLVEFSQMAELAERLRNTGKRVVTTNGCFDLLHWGHIQYLFQARLLGDILICGLNSDRSVRELKGSERPLFPERVRARQLAGLEAVDYVCIFDQSTPEAFIRLVRPELHVKGGDYLVEALPETRVVRELGGEVQILPLAHGFSTTETLKLLREGESSHNG